MTDLEQQVLSLLLTGDDPVVSGLRAQVNGAAVKSREMSGVGFFTTFELPKNLAPVANCKSFKFGDVTATIKGLQHGAGFVLFVKEGFLHLLEGYTYDEPWPKQTTDFELSYNRGNRDWNELRQTWA